MVTIGYVMEGRNVVLNSYRRSQKVRNIARCPEVTFLVETMEAPYSAVRGVLITGRAYLHDDAEWVKRLEERMIMRAVMAGAEVPGDRPGEGCSEEVCHPYRTEHDRQLGPRTPRGNLLRYRVDGVRGVVQERRAVGPAAAHNRLNYADFAEWAGL
jgi:hypothetical protein